MGNFDRDRGGRSGGRGFGGRDGGRAEMYKATCSDCGRSCEVPFRPTQGKPVYCNDCFKRDDDGGSKRFDGGGFGGRSEGRGFGDRDRGRDRDRERPNMHKAICAECGKSCEVPFKPNGEKPVYCSDCFAGGKSGDSFAPRKSDSSSSSSASKDQFVQMNAKLDRILKALEVIVNPKGSEWKPEKSEKAPKAEPKSKSEKVEKAIEAIEAAVIGKAVKVPKAAKAKKAVKKGKK